MAYLEPVSTHCSFDNHAWQPAPTIHLAAIVFFLLTAPVALMAQEATPNAAQVEALQKKLDALQSQMAEVQSELRQISGTGAAAHTEAADLKSAIVTEQKEEVTQVETELTPKQTELSKVTETYRTFSQDPVAAPRINNEPLDPRFPGYFKLPGTATLLRIGGYAKSDFIYDLKPAGNLDSFIPSTIPIPAPATYTNSTISVRPTRLNLDFLVPTKSGDSYRFFLEIDMFGSSSTTPRLRHAYGQAKNFLVGQTFSNFMDPDAGTDQLDFQGPNGWVSIRNPQFRYSLLVPTRPPSVFQRKNRPQT